MHHNRKRDQIIKALQKRRRKSLFLFQITPLLVKKKTCQSLWLMNTTLN